MAFTFNPNDIQMTATGLEFGGDYNVTIADAEYKGTNKTGHEYFVLKFEVADGEQKGARITHSFMDDSTATNYTPFRYREINALLVAVDYQANGSVELNQIVPQLLGKQLSVQVKKFEKSTNDGKVYYNPRVNDIGKWMQAGSKIDKDNPRPSTNGGGNQGGMFDPNAQGMTPPPAPQGDPFGGGF